jgi:hypothetical protein
VSEQEKKDGKFTRDASVDKPGIAGARWWHQSLMDEDQKIARRKVLIGFAVAGGGLAALSAVGVGLYTLFSGEATALASRRALDMQRLYGWDFGARGVPLVFDGVAEGPFVRSELQSLAKAVTPSAQGPNAKYHVVTLLEALFAAPTATLPDPQDGRPAPDAATFRRLADVLTPISTPSMKKAYQAGEALARLSGWRQGLAVLVDMPGPDAVAFAAGAANVFEPVLLLDNWPHPHGVVPSHLALAALAYYQPRFASQSERVFGAPLFVLDRSRTNAYAEASDRFDNRYFARMPRLETLAKDGVRALLYVVASPAALPEPQDLQAVLAARAAGGADAGVEVRALALSDFANDPAANQPDKLFYKGSARADAAFWDDYSFGSQPAPAAPPASGSTAQRTASAWTTSSPTRDYRFVARPPGPQLSNLGHVPVVATASGLVLAAALDRQLSLQRYAGGWRQGSANRFSSGGWGG